ncbi:MAG: hypothetical protein ABI840_06755 [bacterium]
MFRINYWILYVLIFLATAILYFPSLNSYFVNDDYNWIQYKSFYEILSTFWGGWGHGALYRPLTRLLFYFEFLVFDKNPIGYHVISLFLHSTVLFIMFRIAVLIFSSQTIGYLILILSLFFFPFHEAVCWISSQTLLLGSVFVSLSLFYFVNYLIKNNNRNYYLSVAAYLLSLLSYESSIALPALCFISYFIFNKFDFQNIKKVLKLLIPFFLLSAVYLVYRKIVLYGLPEANELATNFMRWFLNYTDYFKSQILRNTPLLILFVISLISLIWIKKSQLKYVIFCLLWIFCAYLPFSLIGGYTGRFAHFSLFGINFFIGYLLFNLENKFKKLKIPIIILLLIYCGFNIYRINQNANYWYEAGEIAKEIPVQLKNLHSDFPENSTLIFYDVPLIYHQSGVFLSYFEDVIQSNYSNRLKIIHTAHPFNKDFKKELYENKEGVFEFRYSLKDRELVEIN